MIRKLQLVSRTTQLKKRRNDENKERVGTGPSQVHD